MRPSGFLSALQPVALAIYLCVTVSGQVATTSAPTPLSASNSPMVPRCSEIAASDPRFAPLAQVCQYALAPNNLPNFACHEEEEQLEYSPKRWWHRRGLMTAEVTFAQGQRNQYANVTMDGFRIRKLTEPHSWQEVMEYFTHDPLGGAKDLNHFGRDLLEAFAAQNHASFEYKGEVNVDGTTRELFGFGIKKQDNNSSLYTGSPFRLGLEGLIWIDKTTSLLREIDLHATEIDSKFPNKLYTNATNYESVSIPDLGQFLVPIVGEGLVCDRWDRCWWNVLTFKNCHKGAASSRILPDNNTHK